MVRVIKWHINIKADNTVTLSFIASINPPRQTFHPMSGQIVSLAVPNTLSSGTFTSAHPFIFPSRLIWQLAPKFFFVSSEVAMVPLRVSMKSFCCSIGSAKPQLLLLWIPPIHPISPCFCSKWLSERLCIIVYAER